MHGDVDEAKRRIDDAFRKADPSWISAAYSYKPCHPP